MKDIHTEIEDMEEWGNKFLPKEWYAKFIPLMFIAKSIVYLADKLTAQKEVSK